MRKVFDYIFFSAIVLIPFFMAIAPAPVNIFMGLLIFSYLAQGMIKKEGILPKTGVNLPLLFFFLLTCISLFNSIALRDSLRGGVLRLLLYIFLLFGVSAGIKNKRQLKLVVFAIVAGLVLASLDAIWQVAAGFDFIRHYQPVINIGLVRATAAFKDSNILGIYLSGLAPLVFGLALYYFKKGKRAVFITLSLVILLGVILTYSRPTLLAIYLALFFFALVKRDKLLLGALLVITLLSPFLAPPAVKNWAKEVEYNPLRFMCNDDRIAVYRNSLHMIKAHPFIGVGANAFMNSYKQYKEFPEYRNVVTLDEMKAHNIYLQMAGETGLLGLGIFFWLLYCLFKKAREIYKQAKDDYVKIVVLSLVACLVAFLVNGLTESSLYYSRVALLFWYLAGFLLALEKINYADVSGSD